MQTTMTSLRQAWLQPCQWWHCPSLIVQSCPRSERSCGAGARPQARQSSLPLGQEAVFSATVLTREAGELWSHEGPPLPGASACLLQGCCPSSVVLPQCLSLHLLHLCTCRPLAGRACRAVATPHLLLTQAALCSL